MDQAKSMMDQKGSSGPCCANGLHKAFRSQLSNGGSHSPSGGSHDGYHHLHHDPQTNGTNGSPAKRCRLRRRLDSLRKNRPRGSQWPNVAQALPLITSFFRRIVVEASGPSQCPAFCYLLTSLACVRREN
ncbi:hypothetical protein SRHO_G00128600 [Serrasalmus rhombeus]